MIEQYRALIERALAYSGGTHTFEDVAELIVSGKAQLWPAQRGVAVTEIVEYPRKRVLHVFLAAGDMDQLLDMIDAAADWGRSQGATAMTMSGRMGWLRVLDKHGFTPLNVTMERNI